MRCLLRLGKGQGILLRCSTLENRNNMRPQKSSYAPHPDRVSISGVIDLQLLELRTPQGSEAIVTDLAKRNRRDTSVPDAAQMA